MALTSAAVVNMALELIATQVTIESLDDGSTAANAAQIVYAPMVRLLLRDLEPDFARTTAPLTLAGVATPIAPWAYEYLYPADCVRLRQVRPPASGSGAQTDPFNPLPVRSNVAFDTAIATKVILSNQQDALAVYTSSSVTEVQWDATFTEAFMRRLANPLAMALSGRPDFANDVLQQAQQMASICEVVDESSMRRGG